MTSNDFQPGAPLNLSGNSVAQYLGDEASKILDPNKDTSRADPSPTFQQGVQDTTPTAGKMSTTKMVLLAIAAIGAIYLLAKAR